MEWWKIVLSLAVVFAIANAEGNTLDLTDDTYEEALKSNPIIMIKFYAPWCGHCKAFKPEYDKAADMILEQGKPYVLADLDAAAHKKAAEKNSIQGFPTVKLFLNGVAIEYTGDRKAEAIISFIDKKTQPSSKKLSTLEEVKEVEKAKGLRCIVAIEDEKTLATYMDFTKSIEEYLLYHTSSDLLKQAFPKATGYMVVLKDFDEMVVFPEDKTFDSDSFSEILSSNSIPLVSEFNQKVVEILFKEHTHKGVMLFTSADFAEKAETEKIFSSVAAKLKAKDLIFVVIDIKNEWGSRAAEFFGVTEEMLPVFEIMEIKEEMFRYRLNEAFTEENIINFFNSWKDNKAARFLKSEEVPTENPGPVYKLVGKTFKKEVLENDNDVMVKIYAPWCGHCKKLAPIYANVAESIKDNSKVKLYEVDGSKNDLEGITFQGFPTVYFFPGNKKTEPISYEGERTEEAIGSFLKQNCFNEINLPDLQSKDERIGSDDL